MRQLVAYEVINDGPRPVVRKTFRKAVAVVTPVPDANGVITYF